ncbi:MAG: hypothetical protein ACRDWH_00785 [Acidimicrobiia bacterium]
MRFTVQPWSPEYGTPGGREELDAPAANVDIEVDASRWAPIAAAVDPAPEVLFVDGVRRIDANLWIEEEDGSPVLALAASYGAGAVLCNHAARVVGEEIRRGVFTSASGASDIVARGAHYQVRHTSGIVAEDLWLGLQQRMGELEGLVAGEHSQVPLIVVDGPLSHRQHVPGAVGYIKTQHVQYLPPNLRPILGRLGPGDRTPLFLTTTSWSRFSWYLKLPLKAAGPMDGIVRAEITADHELAAARRIADLAGATLCRYASVAHKDPRAPQNLYPVGQLERRLHHLLGDRDLLYRSLRTAARQS